MLRDFIRHMTIGIAVLVVMGGVYALMQWIVYGKVIW